MKIKIKEDTCVGCGICSNICPEGIEMVGGKAKIKDKNAPCLREATNACPRKSIILGSHNLNSGNDNFNRD